MLETHSCCLEQKWIGKSVLQTIWLSKAMQNGAWESTESAEERLILLRRVQRWDHPYSNYSTLNQHRVTAPLHTPHTHTQTGQPINNKSTEIPGWSLLSCRSGRFVIWFTKQTMCHWTFRPTQRVMHETDWCDLLLVIGFSLTLEHFKPERFYWYIQVFRQAFYFNMDYVRTTDNSQLKTPKSNK